jgi:hypothetical protein
MSGARNDYAGKADRWLLVVELGARDLQYATSPATVATLDGRSLPFNGGLSELSANLSEAGQAQFQVEILDTPSPSWAELVARGHLLERRPAVLRLHHDGQTLEQAQVFARGVISGIRYGGPGELLTFTIEGDPGFQALELPNPSQVVDGTTWPVRGGFAGDPQIEGQRYPWVIGYPGDLAGVAKPAVPALLVEERSPSTDDRWLIGNSHLHAALRGGGSVTLFDETAGTSQVLTPLDPATVADGIDKLGQRVTLVEGTGGAVAAAQGSEYYTAHLVGSGGGIRGDHGTGPIRAWGEVVRYFLERYTTVQIDPGRMAAAESAFEGVKIDTWFTEMPNVWDWITGTLLPLVSARIVDSGRGLWFAPMDYGATSAKAIRWLSVERGEIRRTSLAQPRTTTIRNRLELRYAVSKGSPLATRVLNGEPGLVEALPGVTNDERVWGNYLCYRSQADLGTVLPYSLTTPVIWDGASAAVILQSMAERWALPKRAIQYEGDQGLRNLEIGDVLVLSDAELVISEAVAIVEDMVQGPGSTLLDLTVLDHPIHRTLSTG